MVLFGKDTQVYIYRGHILSNSFRKNVCGDIEALNIIFRYIRPPINLAPSKYEHIRSIGVHKLPLIMRRP